VPNPKKIPEHRERKKKNQSSPQASISRSEQEQRRKKGKRGLKRPPGRWGGRYKKRPRETKLGNRKKFQRLVFRGNRLFAIGRIEGRYEEKQRTKICHWGSRVACSLTTRVGDWGRNTWSKRTSNAQAKRCKFGGRGRDQIDDSKSPWGKERLRFREKVQRGFGVGPV